MRTLVVFAAALFAGPALAYCPSFPDDASTGYTANKTARLMCQQAELAEAARQLRDAQIQAAMEAQIRSLELQQRMSRTLVQSLIVQPRF